LFSPDTWLILGIGCAVVGVLGMFWLAVLGIMGIASRSDERMEILAARRVMNDVITSSADDEDDSNTLKWILIVRTAIQMHRKEMKLHE